MIIIWGSRLMGKVDVVPGLFHVATQFGHLNYLPLIPMGTYLILSQDGSGFRGMPIGFSFKSMLMAWVRTGLFLVAIIASIVAAIAIGDGKTGEWVIPVTVAVGAWTVFALTWHRVASRASFRRACELGELVGLNEDGFALLHQIYGEAPPRGFGVKAAPIRAEPVADVSIVPAASFSPDSYMSVPRAPIPLEPAPTPVSAPREREPDRLGL